MFLLNTIFVMLLFFGDTSFGYSSNTNEKSAFNASCAYDTDLINQVIERLYQQHHIDKTYTRRLIEYYPCNHRILQLISHPYEEKPWQIYKEHFITQDKLKYGSLFWQEHSKALEISETKFHVPASMIVSIIGIESDYGRVKMKYPALQSLATLSFAYPKRSKFFTTELMALIILGKEQNIDITALYGSYAGALGMPQFMPSSYRSFCSNYDGAGPCDLFHNVDDSISSIANYLHQFGWKPHLPVAEQIEFNPGAFNIPIENNYSLIKLHFNQNEHDHHYNINRPTDLFTLKVAQEKQNWFLYNNFHVILRYNQSALYAMVATQLADQLEYNHSKGLMN